MGMIGKASRYAGLGTIMPKTKGITATIRIAVHENRLKTVLITLAKNTSLSLSLICSAADSVHDRLNIVKAVVYTVGNLWLIESRPLLATPINIETIVLSDAPITHQARLFGIRGMQ